MNKSSTLKKYYDARSACQVLGCLIKNPNLIKDRKYQLEEEDFKDNVHKTIYICVYNLVQQGIKKIGFAEIETYLANTDKVAHSKIFESEKNKEWLYKVIQDTNLANFEYHYNTLRKFALLRNYIENGQDVSDILDVNELDPTEVKRQRDEFNNMSIDDIIHYMDVRNLQSKRRFVVKNSTQKVKAGDGDRELRKEMKKKPAYGHNFESGYINTITRGINADKFMLHTRDTGKGKTRIAIKRLIEFTAPYIWDSTSSSYIPNPNGQNNAGLYIGTELDLKTEVKPIMWACLSGIDEDKIRDNDLTEEEEERLDKAIEILENTNLYTERESNLGLAYLWQTIEEYVVNKNVKLVEVDYIELTLEMIKEYSLGAKGMSVREDMVLLNVSANLKDMAHDFGITLEAWTQVSNEFRTEGRRNQSAIKGAKSLPNKCDVGTIEYEPTKKELEKLQPIIEKVRGIGHRVPNICFSFYKNRGGKFNNIKVWGWQNLGNMEYHDLFVTNENYELINMDKTFTDWLEDKNE